MQTVEDFGIRQIKDDVAKLEMQIRTINMPDKLRFRKMNLLAEFYEHLGEYEKADNTALTVIKQGTIVAKKDMEVLDIVRDAYCVRGKRHFDDYMIATEWNREKNARFWLPRRKILEGKFGIATKLDNFMTDPNKRLLSLSLPPGTGKALNENTPVMTSKGWKNHGDLKVGDKVVGLNGEYVKVTHVFPKAEQNCRVHFSDGSYIDCHENHEWVIYDRSAGKEKILDTKTIESRQLESGGTEKKRGHRYNIQIVNREPMKGEHKDLKVAPYTFGAWLGDGSTSEPRMTNDKNDLDIISGIQQDGYEIMSQWTHKTTGCVMTSFVGLRKDLQEYGLCKSRESVPKYIPEEYITASLEQRLELLAAMIDTDGCKAGQSKIHYSTTNEQIKDGLLQLLATFYWRACVVVEEPHKSTTREIEGRKPCYIISFTPTMEIPCRLERKRVKPREVLRKIAITKVERIKPTTGNCIEVEGGIYCAGEHMIPTHNSTLIKFLLAYVAGVYPMSANMYVSYSDGMIKMMYDSVVDMLTDDFEYQHIRIFGERAAPVTSAQYGTISYRRRGDFPTIGMISLGGSVTGRTRANKFLITDDLVKNAEVARSPERLEKLWQDYTSTLTTRQIGDDVKQIMLGTIWSAYDPISRMMSEHENDPRYEFVCIPVWDENEHSNFMYDHPDRYTDEKIRERQESLDPVDFSCLYLQNPVEKEGMPLKANELIYYNGVLPDGEPDDIFFVVDVAWGGGDSLSMPIIYVYGDEWYLHDVVFDTSDKEVTRPRVVGKILKHSCKSGRFEANNGGDEYADKVDEILRNDYGYICNITSQKAPTNMGKLVRIEQYVPEIKKVYYRGKDFRDDEYNRFMKEMCSISFRSKNLHDDAADSMAMAVDYKNTVVRHCKVSKFKRNGNL